MGRGWAFGVALLVGCGGVVVAPPDGVPEVSPSAFRFAPVVPGRGSVGTFVLANRGDVILKIQGIRPPAGIPPCFQLPEESGVLLPPGAGIEIPVGFKPTTPGTFSGQLTIETNSMSRPEVVVTFEGSTL